ncbi:hypothetical protein Tco_0970475 [Tanacetum coccineum]
MPLLSPHSPLLFIINNKPTKIDTKTSHVNTKTVTLKDQDLISVEDSSTVLLLKLKDVDTMSNMYMICKSKGFMDLKIHHVGGLWIWIQFPSLSSCSKFQDNVTLKSFYTILKYASPSFKVDERMVWIEISGLPLCSWGSNAFKKVEYVVEENPIDDLNDLNDNLNDLAQELKEDEVHEDDLNVNF